MSATNLIAAVVSVPNPQSAIFTSPKTAPKRLFKVYRFKNNNREFMFTPNFFSASQFLEEGLTCQN